MVAGVITISPRGITTSYIAAVNLTETNFEAVKDIKFAPKFSQAERLEESSSSEIHFFPMSSMFQFFDSL